MRVFRNIIILLITVAMLFLSGSSSAVASDSSCAEQIVPLLNQHGFPVDRFAPVFGCSSASGDRWGSPRISTLNYDPQDVGLSPRLQNIVAQIDAMATSRMLAPGVQFDRQTGTAFVQGARGLDSIDMADQTLSSTPNWLNNYTESYGQSVVGYLSAYRTENQELIAYLNWIMNMRDSALETVSMDTNPLAKAGFLSAWGYGSIPWPWLALNPQLLKVYGQEISGSSLPGQNENTIDRRACSLTVDLDLDRWARPRLN